MADIAVANSIVVWKLCRAVDCGFLVFCFVPGGHPTISRMILSTTRNTLLLPDSIPVDFRSHDVLHPTSVWPFGRKR